MESSIFSVLQSKIPNNLDPNKNYPVLNAALLANGYSLWLTEERVFAQCPTSTDQNTSWGPLDSPATAKSSLKLSSVAWVPDGNSVFIGTSDGTLVALALYKDLPQLRYVARLNLVTSLKLSSEENNSVDEIACLSFPSKADTNESETSFLFAQMRIGKVVMVTFQGTTVPKISELPFTYQKVCAMGCSQQLSSIHHGVKFSGRIFVATLDAEEGLLQICHVDESSNARTQQFKMESFLHNWHETWRPENDTKFNMYLSSNLVVCLCRWQILSHGNSEYRFVKFDLRSGLLLNTKTINLPNGISLILYDFILFI
eukprot:GHVP01037787.1.p1 GENE.GHVP01037787.1~~GHVP01037787.1.p1  ORF type:complete len:324 (+),score=47.45 GHVP01037787.1:31-972(+)